jgi:3-phenylpropionate/trans-cinnamate dioxygenase ferredoxin reductase subunit
MPIVKADLGQCQGYANCVVAADDTFDIGDDGVVVLLRVQFPESDRARVEAAARACPVSALSVASE